MVCSSDSVFLSIFIKLILHAGSGLSKQSAHIFDDQQWEVQQKGRGVRSDNSFDLLGGDDDLNEIKKSFGEQCSPLSNEESWWRSECSAQRFLECNPKTRRCDCRGGRKWNSNVNNDEIFMANYDHGNGTRSHFKEDGITSGDCVAPIVRGRSGSRADGDTVNATYGGKDYVLVLNPQYCWDNARDACVANGMILASVDTEDVNNFLKGFLPKHTTSRVYIGGFSEAKSNAEMSSKPHHWLETGKPVTKNWCSGEPNNARKHPDVCLEYVVDQQCVNDVTCLGPQRPYLCSKKSSTHRNTTPRPPNDEGGCKCYTCESVMSDPMTNSCKDRPASNPVTYCRKGEGCRTLAIYSSKYKSWVVRRGCVKLRDRVSRCVRHPPFSALDCPDCTEPSCECICAKDRCNDFIYPGDGWDPCGNQFPCERETTTEKKEEETVPSEPIPFQCWTCEAVSTNKSSYACVHHPEKTNLVTCQPGEECLTTTFISSEKGGSVLVRRCEKPNGNTNVCVPDIASTGSRGRCDGCEDPSCECRCNVSGCNDSVYQGGGWVACGDRKKKK